MNSLFKADNDEIVVCPDFLHDTKMGRWLNRDPIGEKGGLNLYAFVSNDPVNWVNPWGLEYEHVGFGHDTSRRAYISYHNRRVVTYNDNQWVSNDGTPIDGNRSSIMSDYETRGEAGDICEVASGIAKDVMGAAVEEAAKDIHPALALALALPVQFINYVFGATPAY